MKDVLLLTSTKKRVSKFSLTPPLLLLISTFIYFTPAVAGGFEMIFSNGTSGHAKYSSVTSYIAIIILTLIIIYIIFNRPLELNILARKNIKYEAGSLLIIIAPLIIYTLLTPELFSPYKSEVLDATNRLHSLFYNLCILGILFSSLTGIRKNYLIFIVCLLGLLLAMYIGHRSYIAITVIGVAYINFRNKSLLKIRASHAFIIVICFFILIIYKPIYSAVKDGNIELILYRLEPANIIESAIIGSEPLVTYSILDHVVTNNFKQKCSNIWITPLTVIPFTDSILGSSKCSFNWQVQRAYFSGYSGGIAANIWAEFYSNFNIIGVPILLVTLFTLCSLVEKLMAKTSSPIIISGFIVMIIQMTFYIQRNEFLTAFTFGKRAIYCSLIVYIFSKILLLLFPIKNRVFNTRKN